MEKTISYFMHKISTVFLACFFVLSSALAVFYGDVDPRNIASARLGYYVNGNITIIGTVHNLNLTLRALPQEGVIEEYHSSSIGEQSTDEFGNTVFNAFISSINTDLTYFINAVSRTERMIASLDGPGRFPPQTETIPFEVQKYLEFTEYIDYVEGIGELASEITAGSLNSLDAVNKLSLWCAENITYNTTWTKNVEPASLVFQERQGVCDEITSLFIAMCRSIGVPARYVGGYAYSNINDMFGPHAWAEVYISGEWVPYDPTYNEHGYVDASHLKLYHAPDPAEAIIKVTYPVTGTERAVTHSPVFDVQWTQEPEEGVASFQTSLSILDEKSAEVTSMSGDDYILLILSITNPSRSYYPITVFLTKTTSMELIHGHSATPVILYPRMTMKVFYILHSPQGLDPSHYYVHPVNFEIVGGGSVKRNITVNPSIPKRSSLSNLQAILSVLQDDLISSIPSTGTADVTRINLTDLRISPAESFGENVTLSGTVKNTGNELLRNTFLRISYDDYEFNYSLGDLLINRAKNFSVSLKVPETPGMQNVYVIAQSGSYSSSGLSSFTYSLGAKVDMSYEGDDVVYDSDKANFTLNFNVAGSIRNAVLIIDTPFGNVTQDMGMLSQNYYPVLLDSSYLRGGNNDLLFMIRYTDSEGNTQSASITQSIEKRYTNPLLQIWDSIINFFRGLFTN